MNEEALEVRLSHILRDCSVGAIVQGEKFMVSVQDISRWYSGEPPPDREIRYVAQVRAALGIEERLCEPPTGSVTDQHNVEGTLIPATRFPGWMRCPGRNCGLLHNRPWRGRDVGTRLSCQDCGRELEQVPWVVAHKAGFLADVPWHRLAHRSGQGASVSKSCKADWSEPYLRLVEGEGPRSVRCTRCRAEGVMTRRLAFPRNQGTQPWVRPPPPPVPEEAWLLEVNDVRVHASWTSSALVIPPESRIRKGTVVDRLYGNSSFLEKLKTRVPLRRKSALKVISRELRCTESEVIEAERLIESGYPAIVSIDTTAGLDRLEFEALIKEIEDFNDDEDFVTQHRTRDWKLWGRSLHGEVRRVVDAVEHLIEVPRLKEITILRGFWRLGGDEAIPPDLTGDTGWLPALALRGEGLFFTLDEATLRKWENQPDLWHRAEGFRQRYEAFRPYGTARAVDISPRFLMLHTLAHCLIRQLEADGGYPAASLRERIYCGGGPSPMAGILVYVAVPDMIGSLGGLVELAEPVRFLRHLVRAFEVASWCSLDPICAGHEGQGPDLLNGAACAACALVPEPSCQHGNVLLDRTFIKGDAARNISSLLDNV